MDKIIFSDIELEDFELEDKDNHYNREFEVALEDHIENAMNMKLENLRSALMDKLKEMEDEMKYMVKENIDKVLAKFEEQR